MTQADSKGFHKITCVRKTFFLHKKIKIQNSKYILRSRFLVKDGEKTQVAIFITLFQASIFFGNFFREKRIAREQTTSL